MLVCLHAHVLNIIYTDINQQSTDQQRNMPTQYYSSLKSFITFFYKTNEEMTAAQKVENIGRGLKRSPPLSKYFEKYPQE